MSSGVSDRMLPPFLDDHRPANGDADVRMAQAVRLADILAASWRRGVFCRAEEMLADHASLLSHPQAAVRVIYEEICELQRLGQEISLGELQRRFPQFQKELAVVLDCHRLLELEPQGPQFPAVGEMLGDFRLLAELGRGARGRVYLAEEAFLAGRPMILKVTPLGDEEHLKLARLQHTYIVPLYSVQDFPERNMRKLCMPCLGGATFQQLLRNLQAVPPEKRTGHDLVKAMEATVAETRLFWPSKSPNRRFLEHASYVQGICWIGICLAEALHYAHEQDLIHFDVKPSNVLLTADCQPMLLDFHLARGPIRPLGNEPQWLGGTPIYMSPEQRAAWQACTNHQPLATPVDGRSDIYSLGLLLREALYGEPRESDEADVSLDPRSHLSKGLRDVLHRCLALDPEARYPTGALLAEDLRRHLTNRPLVGVRNRSVVERWRKWNRRRPHALLVLLLFITLFGTLTALGVFYGMQRSQHHRVAEDALADGRRQMEQRQFDEAVNAFDRGLGQLGGFLGKGPVWTELLHQRQRAVRAHDLHVLHEQVERSRYLQSDDLLSPTALRELDFQCHDIWMQRERFLAKEGPSLDAELEEAARRDLIDVAVLWSNCRVRLATALEVNDVRRASLQVLDEAETLLGPSPSLSQERWLQAQALGLQAESRRIAEAKPVPRTAWELYALGRLFLREGDLVQAAESFNKAVEMSPKDFWPWFGKGLCASKRKLDDEAVTAFSVCVALAPECAACYYNRGLALMARGECASALRDYDRALQIDPALAGAALNRGAVHLHEARLTEAEADFHLAQSLGANQAAVQFNLALVHQARKEPAAALACVERALEIEPGHAPAQGLRARLQKQQIPSLPKRQQSH